MWQVKFLMEHSAVFPSSFYVFKLQTLMLILVEQEFNSITFIQRLHSINNEMVDFCYKLCKMLIFSN